MKTHVPALLIALHLSGIAACRHLLTFSSSVEVVPDFLLKHSSNNNGDMGFSITEEAAPSQEGNRFRGKAHLSHSMVRAIWDILSEPGPEEPIALRKETFVATVTMDETTKKHADYYVDPLGKRRLVEHDERVAFVFLNTNPDAFFVHNDISVPVVEGHLVHFNGALPHNTVIKTGSVRLLGPFYSADLSTSVGSSISPPPSTTPSTLPSTSPSTQPSTSPSISPSTLPSNLPSTSPSASMNPSSSPMGSKTSKTGKSISKTGKKGSNEPTPEPDKEKLFDEVSMSFNTFNGMSLPYSMSF